MEGLKVDEVDEGRKGVTITIRKTEGRWGGKVTIMIKGRKGVIITIRLKVDQGWEGKLVIGF